MVKQVFQTFLFFKNEGFFVFYSVTLVAMILDRHLEWRSLDPTLDISSPFVKRKKHSAFFFSFASFSFKKDPTFKKNAYFLLHLVIR